MDLYFEIPIKFSLDIIEIEDTHIQSFKNSIKIEITHSTGNLTYYVEDIWFKCCDWDEFLKNLSSNYTSKHSFESVIHDMSNSFVISITHIDGEKDFTFKIKIDKPSIYLGLIEINYQKKISAEEVGIINKKFSEFPKWWSTLPCPSSDKMGI